jgi:hypothetical protein
VAIIENKGMVRHKITLMVYDLCVFRKTDSITQSADQRIVEFDRYASGSWLTGGLTYLFVEPGVKSQYSVPLPILEECVFVHLKARLSYDGRDEEFFDERVFAVPSQ